MDAFKQIINELQADVDNRLAQQNNYCISKIERGGFGQEYYKEKLNKIKSLKEDLDKVFEKYG